MATRAQAELKAFEKRYGIGELNRSKNKGTGEVSDDVLKQWSAKTKAYGDAGTKRDIKIHQEQMTRDRAQAELKAVTPAPKRSAASQASSEDYNRRQNQKQQGQAERDFAHSEDRRRQAIANRSGPVRQSTRDLSGQDRRFNERVAGYGQARGQRGGQEARGMQERSARGRRQGKLSGGGQRRGGGFSGIATAIGDMAKDRGVAPRGGQRGGSRGGGRSPMRPAPEPTPTKGEGWWNEPRKAATSEEGRIALLTGKGGGSGSVGTTSNAADRIALLTGSGSSTSDDDRRALLTGSADDDSRRALLTGSADNRQSASDRMKMLTGESDPVSETRSVYGGREEYDPQDRAFNQQFSEAPRGPQPWDNDGGPHSRPSTPAPSTRENLLTGQSGTPSSSTPVSSSNTSSWEDRIAQLEGKIAGVSTGGGSGGWQEDRIAQLEGRQPQDLSGIQGRLDKLENRKPIINNSTVDLSGVQGRLDKLEGKGSDWQEDRIADLENRQPQDLSGIQGRLKDVEGRSDDTSWKDRLSSLENYYKNDPPPADSTGNRYEDKMANLNKMWERTGKAQSWGDDALAETGYKGKDAWDYSYANDQGQAWAKDLPTGYVEGIRNLNREYNKPVHEAIIKGQEYKAYDPRAAARLRYLDQENIHEDTYLGKGNWDDAYGEQVSGKGKGNYDRYFASQSGLEKDSDDYTQRFSDRWGSMGKDYAWYQ
tara:strand:- start:5592 stop:7718 length:2127 start_codon:yes stop_codon:yes gene_type:complete